MLSIIVLNFNKDFCSIKRCLESILNQKEKNIEIIISDDNSDFFDLDNINKLLNNYEKKVIIIKNNKNIGTVKNLKNAISKSSGEYIFAISSDDMLCDQNVLTDIYKKIKGGKIDILLGNSIKITEKKEIIGISPSFCYKRILREFDEKKVLKKLYFSNFLGGTGIVIKRNVFFDFNILDSEILLTEDYLIWLNTVNKGLIIRYYDRNMVFYFEGGISSNKNNDISIGKQLYDDYYHIITKFIMTDFEKMSIYNRREVLYLYAKSKLKRQNSVDVFRAALLSVLNFDVIIRRKIRKLFYGITDYIYIFLNKQKLNLNYLDKERQIKC